MITQAAVNWNLAEYHAQPTRRIPADAFRPIDTLACGPRVRELARQAHAAVAAGDRALAAALKAEAQALVDAELTPAPPVYIPTVDQIDYGALTNFLNACDQACQRPIPRRNPVLDRALACLESQADDAEALLAAYAQQGRRNSPGAEELRYQRSIRDLSRKAADLLRIEGLPERVRDGWLVRSGSTVYVVSDTTPRRCDCQAGRAGVRCKHTLMVEAVAQAANERKAV
jgi:hypothetical protein